MKCSLFAKEGLSLPFKYIIEKIWSEGNNPKDPNETIRQYMQNNGINIESLNLTSDEDKLLDNNDLVLDVTFLNMFLRLIWAFEANDQKYEFLKDLKKMRNIAIHEFTGSHQLFQRMNDTAKQTIEKAKADFGVEDDKALQCTNELQNLHSEIDNMAIINRVRLRITHFYYKSNL